MRTEPLSWETEVASIENCPGTGRSRRFGFGRLDPYQKIEPLSVALIIERDVHGHHAHAVPEAVRMGVELIGLDAHRSFRR